MASAGRRLAHNLLGSVRRRADTSDIVQNVSIQLTRQFGDDFDAVSDAYLAAAVNGHAAKIARFHNRQRRAVSRDNQLSDQSSASLTPEEILQKRETAAVLASAIAQLPVDKQRLVFLRVFQDLTYREIAEETGGNERTVEREFKRAVRQMRYLLAEFDDEWQSEEK